MLTGKIIVPIEDATLAEELEVEFGNLRWVSDKIVLIEFGPTLINPIDSHTWPTGTKVVLSWEAP